MWDLLWLRKLHISKINNNLPPKISSAWLPIASKSKPVNMNQVFQSIFPVSCYKSLRKKSLLILQLPSLLYGWRTDRLWTVNSSLVITLRNRNYTQFQNIANGKFTSSTSLFSTPSNKTNTTPCRSLANWLTDKMRHVMLMNLFLATRQQQ